MLMCALVPPHHEIVDLFLLLDILEEFQYAIVKAFGVSYCVRTRKDHRRAEGKSTLGEKGRCIQQGETLIRLNTNLSSDVSNGSWGDVCHAMNSCISRSRSLVLLLDGTRRCEDVLVRLHETQVNILARSTTMKPAY